MNAEVPRTSDSDGLDPKGMPTTSSWISKPGRSRPTPPKSQPHTQPISSTPTPPPEELGHHEAPPGNSIYFSGDPEESVQDSVQLEGPSISEPPTRANSPEQPAAPSENRDVGPELPPPVQEERIVVELTEGWWWKILLGWLVLIISVTAILARIHEEQGRKKSRQPLQEAHIIQATRNFTGTDLSKGTETGWHYLKSPTRTRSGSPSTSLSITPTNTRTQWPSSPLTSSPTPSCVASMTPSGSEFWHIECSVRSVLGNCDLSCWQYISWPVVSWHYGEQNCMDTVSHCLVTGTSAAAEVVE